MPRIPSKEEIIHKLHTDDEWLCRAIAALNLKQTVDERQVEQTRYHNQQGFRPGDARKGTGMANFYAKTGFLTPKQKAWWRKRTPSGKSRIEVYATQLQNIAKDRAARQQGQQVSG